MKNHIKRCTFFANKQNAFTPCHKIGNQVGDGLAFTGTRRALYNITFSGSAFKNGLCLCRVGGNYMIPFIGFDLNQMFVL